MNQEHFTFHLQYKHSDRLDNRKYEKLSYPQNPKRCDPIHSLGARGPRMCRPTLEMPATCEKNLWYPGYPIQITLLKMPPHGEMPFATSYSNSKTVQFDLSDYQELVIGQVKSDS